jgi:hypothetical protein
MKRVRSGLLALLVFAALHCGGGTELPSPLVRVDLRDKLPAKVLKEMRALGGSYECRREVTLRAEGASQSFVVTWRIYDHKESRYFTAVGVEPDGPTRGATSPEATATVDELKREGGASVLPVHLLWSAREGCSTVSARKIVKLRSDDPACKQPKSKLKIFSK